MPTQRNKGRNSYEGNDSPPLVDVMSKPRIPFLSCLCGAREDDHGQQRNTCWSCGKQHGMGEFRASQGGEGR